MAHKNVVYTSIFGGYDKLNPVDPSWDCDFVCFTDDSACQAEGWRIQLISEPETPPPVLNRRFKILPHLYLDNYATSLYVDGNIQLKNDPTLLFKRYDDHNFVAPVHRDRDCVYIEAKTCLELNLIDSELYEKLILKYRSIAIPERYGLTENNVLLRKHLDPLVSKVMDEWWSEFRQVGKRDQTILPVLLWKHHLPITALLEGPRYTDKFFAIRLHAADQNKNILRRAVRIAQIRRHLGLHYRILSKLARVVSATFKVSSKLRLNS